ncbi:SAM-dependent methyltransferase [Evansella sp. AB-rgal1]|uniref:SAM-dependent methyltransferase n=1 Tax=Evansella sp. AB-rgal1 TaxID=3242696 RepID=UPI00359E8EC1
MDIKQKISLKKKPLSYSDYITIALYDEDIGYYMNSNTKLGKDGDFYTSNHVHPVFQKTFAKFFVDIIKKENLTPTICEWGAGDGRFAFEVLSYLRDTEKDLYKECTYLIIEASTYHQSILEGKLADFSGKFSVFRNLEEAKEQWSTFEGIVFSNEFFDALPVHVVEKKEDTLCEVMVDINSQGELSEVYSPCQNEELQHWLEEYGPMLPNNHRMEVCLHMKKWISLIANWMTKGMIVSVDYGYSNEELLQNERREGSLRGYYKHQMIHNPLDFPGEMDLTHHIQWDAYQLLMKKNGFEEVFHSTQDQFLLKAGLFSFLQENQNLNPFSESYKQNRAIQSLVYPGGISSTFHVSIQSINLEKKDNYSMFKDDPYQINE